MRLSRGTTDFGCAGWPECHCLCHTHRGGGTHPNRKCDGIDYITPIMEVVDFDRRHSDRWTVDNPQRVIHAREAARREAIRTGLESAGMERTARTDPEYAYSSVLPVYTEWWRGDGIDVIIDWH